MPLQIQLNRGIQSMFCVCGIILSNQTPLGDFGLIWIHLDSIGLTWTPLDSLVITWIFVGFTGTHLNSLELAKTH